MKKNIYPFTRILLYIAAFLSFVGCQTTGSTKKSSLPEFNSDKDYVDYVNSRLDDVKTFKASGILKISNSHKSDSATSAILIKRPNSLRVESFSVFGQSVFFFASKKDTFSIFVPKENKYFMGENTPENIQKVIPLDVSVNEFSEYLMGSFLRNKDDSTVIKFLEDKKIYKIYYYHGDDTRVLWLDPVNLIVTKCAVYNEDEELKSVVTYSDFKEISNTKFPMDITIKFPDLDAKIDVRYDEIQVNDDINDGIFNLNVPENALIIDLDSKVL